MSLQSAACCCPDTERGAAPDPGGLHPAPARGMIPLDPIWTRPGGKGFLVWCNSGRMQPYIRLVTLGVQPMMEYPLSRSLSSGRRITPGSRPGSSGDGPTCSHHSFVPCSIPGSLSRRENCLAVVFPGLVRSAPGQPAFLQAAHLYDSPRTKTAQHIHASLLAKATIARQAPRRFSSAVSQRLSAVFWL